MKYMTLLQKYIYSSFHVHLLDYLSFQFFGNEEKLVSLLVYSSFRLVATSGIRNSSVATSSTSFNSVSATWGIRNSSVATSSTRFNSVSRARIRSEYGATPYSP